MKVQLTRNSWRLRNNPARMVEFIINIDRGKFISEWDSYKLTADGKVDSDPAHYSIAKLESIANTESFNYGIPHGNYFVLFHLFQVFVVDYSLFTFFSAFKMLTKSGSTPFSMHNFFCPFIASAINFCFSSLIRCLISMS